MEINKSLPAIGHVGFIVDNLDESVETFKIFYGIKDFVVYDFIPKRAWVCGEEIFDCKLRIGLSTNEIGPKVELIEPISGNKIPHFSFIKEKGQNIHHVAYYLDSTEEYKYWHDYYSNQTDSKIIFEAEIEDDIFGKRASFYVSRADVAGVVEIARKPVK